MRILGIDPGRYGALALIDTASVTLAVERMPVASRRLETTTKHSVDEDRLATLVRNWHPDTAWIEDVWSRGGEGPVGAFTFGESKGIVRGVLGALGIPRQYVSPARWKADLRVPPDKQAAKGRAWVLFPACTSILASEGKAEAAMIALYGCLTAGVLQPLLKPSR